MILTMFWFAFERRRFEGPPTGERIMARQAEIAAIEERLRRQEAIPLQQETAQ